MSKPTLYVCIRDCYVPEHNGFLVWYRRFVYETIPTQYQGHFRPLRNEEAGNYQISQPAYLAQAEKPEPEPRGLFPVPVLGP